MWPDSIAAFPVCARVGGTPAGGHTSGMPEIDWDELGKDYLALVGSSVVGALVGFVVAVVLHALGVNDWVGLLISVTVATWTTLPLYFRRRRLLKRPSGDNPGHGRTRRPGGPPGC